MNNKKMSVGIAALICVGVFIVFGILAAVTVRGIGVDKFNVNNGWFNFGSGSKKDYNIDQTVTFSKDEIAEYNTISLGSISSDITVTEGDTFEAHLYGQYRGTQEIELVADQSGKHLEVKVRRKGSAFSFNIFGSNMKLDVTIPKSFSDKLSLSSTSGEINMVIDDKELTELTASTTSGDIYCKIKSAEMNGSSTSGSVTFITEAGNMDVGTTSGNVNCTTQAGDIHAGSTSGDVTCKTDAGDINASTVSGGVEIFCNDFDKIVADTTSGGVELTVSKDSSFKINFDSVSGSLDSNLPLSVKSSGKRHFEGTYGSGEGVIDVDTTSGSCDLNMQ